MANKTFSTFALLVNTDTCEGRGPMKEHAYFSSRSEAEKVHNDPRFYKRYGVMGTLGNVEYAVTAKTLKVFDTAEDYWNHSDSAAKQAALEKLTLDERILLGLEK
jgi:hypothetical protein